VTPFRIIFLDIDGVLNSRRWFVANRFDEGKQSTLGELDPEAVARVQTLVDRTGASVVTGEFGCVVAENGLGP